MNAQVKPAPKVDDNHTASICNKCAGSGIYATAVIDGRPYSPTGTTCYPCNGAGWIVKIKRGRRSKVLRENVVKSYISDFESILKEHPERDSVRQRLAELREELESIQGK